jgi:hypothetical protein
MGGLFVGTVLTLIFLPTLYVVMFSKRAAPPPPSGDAMMTAAGAQRP